MAVYSHGTSIRDQIIERRSGLKSSLCKSKQPMINRGGDALPSIITACDAYFLFRSIA
jgi:hypothetical protein